jgi:hypothetical protein
MDFLKLFLRSIALLPSLVQGIEALYGAKTGAQKKDAALAIVSSSINVADAVSARQIADSGKFTAGLNLIVDGVVECLNASLWAKPSEPQQKSNPLKPTV